MAGKKENDRGVAQCSIGCCRDRGRVLCTSSPSTLCCSMQRWDAPRDSPCTLSGCLLPLLFLVVVLLLLLPHRGVRFCVDVLRELPQLDELPEAQLGALGALDGEIETASMTTSNTVLGNVTGCGSFSGSGKTIAHLPFQPSVRMTAHSGQRDEHWGHTILSV